MRFRVLVGVAFAHLVGCYHPATLDCSVQCSAATDCAGGQSCRSGWCAAPNVECDRDGNPVVLDAPMGDASDNANPDPDASVAQQLCQQGCSKGTCVDGVCVIDCSATGSCSTMDVTCPTNLPCRVLCGDNSCAHKVVCGMSSSCEVQCNGTNACGDEIQCPMGDCNVTCSGQSSCKRRTKCGMSCECDVTCSGIGSCPEASECPNAMTCRVGNGCSSIPLGCSTCN